MLLLLSHIDFMEYLDIYKSTCHITGRFSELQKKLGG